MTRAIEEPSWGQNDSSIKNCYIVMHLQFEVKISRHPLRILYSNYGRLHRDDKPAVTFYDGAQRWYNYGKCHRMGGPAFIDDSEEHWYHYGKLHRDDGPAVIFNDGNQYWYHHGERRNDR